MRWSARAPSDSPDNVALASCFEAAATAVSGSDGTSPATRSALYSVTHPLQMDSQRPGGPWFRLQIPNLRSGRSHPTHNSLLTGIRQMSGVESVRRTFTFRRTFTW